MGDVEDVGDERGVGDSRWWQVLQEEWNSLVPAAEAAGISRIRAVKIGAESINQLRLAPGTRGDLNTVPSLINYLGKRNPSLLNKGGTDFEDNIPLRDVATVVNTVPGAMALQVFWDRSEWFNMPGAAIGFAEKPQPGWRFGLPWDLAFIP